MQVEKIKLLAKDYRTQLGGGKGKEILADIKKHCFAENTTFNRDPYEHARNAGRREVWLHIKSMLTMDLDEFERLNKQRSKTNA